MEGERYTDTEQLRMAIQGLRDLASLRFVNPETYRDFAGEVLKDIGIDRGNPEQDIDGWPYRRDTAEWIEADAAQSLMRGQSDRDFDRDMRASGAAWVEPVQATVDEPAGEATPTYTLSAREPAFEVNRWIAEGGEVIPQGEGSHTLTALVQAFVQAVKDFVQGREMEAPTQEHGAER